MYIKHLYVSYSFTTAVEAYQAATRSMARLNRTAALLMHRYGEGIIICFILQDHHNNIIM